MKKYRLYDPAHDCYLSPDCEPTDRKHAVLVTEATWRAMYRAKGFVLEEIGTDEALKRLGAPRLPGFEED